jgi:hypothetical protein
MLRINTVFLLCTDTICRLKLNPTEWFGSRNRYSIAIVWVYKTLREECKLRVFENRLLRRIFGPKRDEVTEEWRRLHNNGSSRGWMGGGGAWTGSIWLRIGTGGGLFCIR